MAAAGREFFHKYGSQLCAEVSQLGQVKFLDVLRGMDGCEIYFHVTDDYCCLKIWA